jgi:hypothetical protein
MSKPRLAINETEGRGSNWHDFEIGWYFPDEGEFGAMLGEERYTEADIAKAKPDDREVVVAYLAALKTEGVQQGSSRIFWETRKHASNALRAIKAAVVNDEKPWPEWAVKARAEGWKPPKGWKP